MRKLALMAVLAAATLGGACNSDDDLTRFDAALTPDNEVPPRTSGASGSASFSFDGTTVTYGITVTNLNNITASHIHSGAAGVNGPVRVFLYEGPVTSVASGSLVQGSFTAANVTGIDFTTLLDEMRAGTAYVNVHTQQYPGGEIRGQLRLLD